MHELAPERLAAFVTVLADRLASDEELELVLAGDVIDFPAIPECCRFTPNPETACGKLERTVRSRRFAPAFRALAAHLAAGHRLTVLLGNHDPELALPQVADAFIAALRARPHDVLMLTDGRAYRTGGVLVEHGNRYDGANRNDWDGLRTIASALSRGEEPPLRLRVSPAAPSSRGSSIRSNPAIPSSTCCTRRASW